MTEMTSIIIDKIREVAFKKVSETDELIKSGILSSIILVDLATLLEEEFKINIPFTEISAENFSTPLRIQAYLQSKFS